MANLIALDVGAKRIGVAAADSTVPIAMPLSTLEVDGTELDAIARLVAQRSAETIVIGYPRNQSGGVTDQTAFVQAFAAKLGGVATIVFQDESLTSVMAEERLKASGKPYSKADIDAFAAVIILQDYLETHHAA